MRTFSFRAALPSDCDAISQLIERSVTETNADDYPPETLQQVVNSFTPDRIRTLISERQMFVALDQDRIIGTAGLVEGVVKSVFVSPDDQKKGVGAALMAHMESLAKEKSFTCLTLQSSITAEGFYNKLGYETLRREIGNNPDPVIITKRFI